MSVITIPFSDQGPLIRVAFSVSEPHRKALESVSKPVPGFVNGVFLIDTGAQTTVVDPEFVSPLALTPTGVIMMETPSTAGAPVPCSQYDVTMVIMAQEKIDPPLVIPAIPVTEASLRSQGIDGLIGRDVLSRCAFFINGKSGSFTLTF